MSERSSNGPTQPDRASEGRRQFSWLARLRRYFSGPVLTQAAWEISPYPDGKSFAVTFIHDADSAYSQRLAPIMDTFDALGFKVTITVFPFWAAWAPDPADLWAKWRAIDPFNSPIAVPLEDPDEARFYRGLQARGHEIGIHTPSETSSKRDEVVRSFELFKTVLGRPARTYVEHSPGNNLDAQCRAGSDRNSEYYNTDLLNASGCWVWVCDAETDFPTDRSRALDVLSDPAGPFSPRASEKYGIDRGFVRSRILPSDGDGFVAAMTDRAIDRLEREGGTALVYCHLAIGWLDPATRQLRSDILERLQSIARRNVWMATGADMLDRFAALGQVEVIARGGELEVANRSDVKLTGLSLRAPAGLTLASGIEHLRRRDDGLVLVGDIEPRSSRVFRVMRS